ncbi:MAG: NADH-quinone oxidoreductase subunit A [Candidatus Omnitrophica bacterium]|nr:NADH-quinone oxidoreductase subunit A [Candidatus Omnitrophota bacterium]
MAIEYVGILISIGFAALISGGMVLAHTLLGGRRPTPEKEEPFECGESPFAGPAGRFSVKFYLVAMLFIIFDIEIIFLFPWAVLYRRLGLFGFIEMAIFLFVLGVGLFYAWKKGALEWER